MSPPAWQHRGRRGDKTRRTASAYLLPPGFKNTKQMCGDRTGSLLRRKMPSLDEVQFRIRQVPEVGLGACRDESRIASAPNDQRRILAFAKKRLPRRIKINIVLVVLKELHHNFAIFVRVQE